MSLLDFAGVDMSFYLFYDVSDEFIYVECAAVDIEHTTVN